jgi:hypothetical protein
VQEGGKVIPYEEFLRKKVAEADARRLQFPNSGGLKGPKAGSCIHVTTDGVRTVLAELERQRECAASWKRSYDEAEGRKY